MPGLEPKSMRWCRRPEVSIYSFMLTSHSSAYPSFHTRTPHCLSDSPAITTQEAPARDWGFRSRGRQGAVTGGARC